MNKYWHVLNIGIQNTLVYRVNFLFRAAFSLVPLTATIYLWRAIYESKGADVSGYTLAQMVSYYLVVMVVDALVSVTDDDWQIAAEIREGQISQFLLKPMDYLAYRFCLYLAGRVVYTVVAVAPVLLFVLFRRQYLVLPPNPTALVCFLVSLGLAGLLQFFISYTMALLAFWVLEVSTFIFIVFAFEYLAGGHLFPLDILPPTLQRILAFTPFPYEFFFPVKIYLGRVSGAALVQGLMVQTGWVVLAYLAARAVWHRGIRRYSAVGG